MFGHETSHSLGWSPADLWAHQAFNPPLVHLPTPPPHPNSTPFTWRARTIRSVSQLSQADMASDESFTITDLVNRLIILYSIRLYYFVHCKYYCSTCRRTTASWVKMKMWRKSSRGYWLEIHSGGGTPSWKSNHYQSRHSQENWQQSLCVFAHF